MVSVSPNLSFVDCLYSPENPVITLALNLELHASLPAATRLFFPLSSPDFFSPGAETILERRGFCQSFHFSADMCLWFCFLICCTTKSADTTEIPSPFAWLLRAKMFLRMTTCFASIALISRFHTVAIARRRASASFPNKRAGVGKRSRICLETSSSMHTGSCSRSVLPRSAPKSFVG